MQRFSSQWWAVHLLDAGTMFLAAMGFFYVAGAPLTKAEALGISLIGSVLFECYLVTKQLRPTNPRAQRE